MLAPLTFPAHSRRLLDRLAEAPLSYDAPGLDPDRPPPGFHVMRQEVELGVGEAVFSGVVHGLLRWEVLTRAGIRVAATSATVAVGATVVQTIGVGGVGLAAPCRVTAVTVGPDTAGFTYGTLPGHPESGEETFEVRRRPDGTVVATIGSVARPAWWAVRLAGPLARRIQRIAVGRYAAALRALAADAVRT